MNSVELGIGTPLAPEILETTASEKILSPTTSKFSKETIRTSLKASTMDGFLTTVFSITTSGILLSNFLVELGASPIVFGILSSIPSLVNLIQPFGAYLSERTTSRFWYSIWTYGSSRLLWLILVIGILAASWGGVNYRQLEILTLIILIFSHSLNALGYSSWMSWLAMIVPRRLRGRYFGLRNSVVSLTNLTCIPLAGIAVSAWAGGALQGYGVVVFVGVLLGLASLVCQFFQVDINPSLHNAYSTKIPLSQKTKSILDVKKPENSSHSPISEISPSQPVSDSQPEQNVISEQPISTWLNIFRNTNFLMFLIYFGVWQGAMHLSVPFFNFYMLDRLHLDVSLVTLYGSIQAGANLLLLIVWGKLADTIGSRRILLFVGVLVIATPLIWLVISNDTIDIWLWIPLLHLFIGGTWAALDLCNNNLQIEVAPIQRQSIYFSVIAAVGGISGALGTVAGGFIADNPSLGGIPGLFIVSSVFRFISLIPLVFIKDTGRN